MSEIAINPFPEIESSNPENTVDGNLLMSGETLDEYFDRIEQEWADKAEKEAIAEIEARLEREALQEQQREIERANIALIENLDPSVKVRVEKVVVKDTKKYENASSSAPSKHEKGGASTESKPQRFVDGKIVDENGVSVIQQMIEKGNVPPEGIARAQKREQELATQGYSISETFRSFNGDGKMWRTVYRLNENGELTYENYQISLVKSNAGKNERYSGEPLLASEQESPASNEDKTDSADAGSTDNHVYDFVNSLFERAEITIAIDTKTEEAVSESPVENLAENQVVASVASEKVQGVVEEAVIVSEKNDNAQETIQSLSVTDKEPTPVVSSEALVQVEKEVFTEEEVASAVVSETAEPVARPERAQDSIVGSSAKADFPARPENVAVDAPAVPAIETAQVIPSSPDYGENEVGVVGQPVEIVENNIEVSPVATASLAAKEYSLDQDRSVVVATEKENDAAVVVDRIELTKNEVRVEHDTQSVNENEVTDSSLEVAQKRSIERANIYQEKTERASTRETEQRTEQSVARKSVAEEKESPRVAAQSKESEPVVAPGISVQRKEVVSAPRAPERNGIRLVRVESRSEVRAGNLSRPTVKEARPELKEQVVERRTPEVGSRATILPSAGNVRPGTPSRTSSSQDPLRVKSEDVGIARPASVLSRNGITLKRAA